MKRLYMTMYRYREGLSEDDRRKLTTKFLETGISPGVIAHYERLDGKGAFMVEEQPEDAASSFELTLKYTPWIEFECSRSPRWRRHSRLSNACTADNQG